MQGALNYSDAITTVSHLSRRRSARLSSARASWRPAPPLGRPVRHSERPRPQEQLDPATDSRVRINSRDDMSGKAACKAALGRSLASGPRRPPLMAMVTRLTRQKGMDLVTYSLGRILSGGVRSPCSAPATPSTRRPCDRAHLPPIPVPARTCRCVHYVRHGTLPCARPAHVCSPAPTCSSCRRSSTPLRPVPDDRHALRHGRCPSCARPPPARPQGHRHPLQHVHRRGHGLHVRELQRRRDGRCRVPPPAPSGTTRPHGIT